jgi:hypothetical protein
MALDIVEQRIAEQQAQEQAAQQEEMNGLPVM